MMPSIPNACGAVASSGGYNTTTAMPAHTIHNHYYGATDRKEEKTTTTTSLPPELSDALTKRLKSNYARKSHLPGLLSTHEQPITGINLSTIDLPSSTARSQEGKDSKSPKPESIGLAHFEKMHAVNHPVEVAEMFDKAPEQSGKLETKAAKHLLITGAPGVGKTTMSQYIAYQWSIGKLWINKFDYLFWIPLRNLLQYPTDVKAEFNLAHVIHRECFNNHRTISIAAIDHILYQAGNRTLFVLDGYDEVAYLLEQSHHPINAILREAFEYEYCMVTSRPYQLPSSDVFQVDRRLENTGFTDSNIESYVTRYFDIFTPPQPEKAQALLTYLKNNLSVWGTAHIPINLALICEIWETETPALVTAEKKEETKPATAPFNPELSLTGLYQKMTLFLLERYLKREGEQTKDLYPTDIYKGCKSELEFLSALAFEGLRAHKIILTAKLQNAVAEKMIETGSSPLFSKILASGFLRAADSPFKKEIDRPHYFIHLMFQEYLAAYYLVHCLKQDVRSAEYLKATEWLRTEKYNPRYQVVLGFIAGLLSLNKDVHTALPRFWQILLSKPFDLTGIGHIRLMIRCLEESRGDNRIPHYSKLLGSIGQWICVSHNSNQNIQDWLHQNLRSSPWIVRQLSTLKRLLTYDKKAETSVKQKIIYSLGNLSAVIARDDILKALLTALCDKNMWVRSHAADVLGKLGTYAAIPEVIQALLITLHDKHVWVKGRAAGALAQLGIHAVTAKVITALFAALYDANIWVRICAADALNKLSTYAAIPHVIQALLTALRDEAIWIRSRAAVSLGLLGTYAATPRVIEALFIALRDDDEDVRSNAAAALGQLGSDAATLQVIEALLIALCDKKNVYVRLNAAEALGKLCSAAATPRVIEALLTALHDKEDMHVRRHAAQALGQLGSAAATPRVIEALLTALRDKNDDVRCNAAETLGLLGAHVETTQVVNALVAALRDENTLVRNRAAEALGKLSASAAIPQLLEVLLEALRNEDHQAFKSCAVLALGLLDTSAQTLEVMNTLLAMLRTAKNPDVIRSISQTLNKLHASQHLHTFDVPFLKTAVAKGVYFSATPLNAFIKTWLDFRLKLAPLAETIPAQHITWLEIIAALAFHRAIPVTLSDTEVHVYEGSVTTIIPLPAKQALLLKTEMLDAFADQARQFGLPHEWYATLKNGGTPYPFEAISRAGIDEKASPPAPAAPSTAPGLSTTSTTAGGHIRRLVFTADPHVASSGPTHAVQGDVTEIVVDIVNAPPENLREVGTWMPHLFGSSRQTPAGASTSTAPSSTTNTQSSINTPIDTTAPSI